MVVESVNTQDVVAIVGGVTSAVVGAAFLLRKVQRMWAGDGEGIAKAEVNAAGSDANRQVIENLRDEVTRLSDANTKLSKMVNDFQVENIQLRGEIAELREQLKTLTRLAGTFANSCSQCPVFHKEVAPELKRLGDKI